MENGIEKVQFSISYDIQLFVLSMCSQKSYIVFHVGHAKLASFMEFGCLGVTHSASPDGSWANTLKPCPTKYP